MYKIKLKKSLLFFQNIKTIWVSMHYFDNIFKKQKKKYVKRKKIGLFYFCSEISLETAFPMQTYCHSCVQMFVCESVDAVC